MDRRSTSEVITSVDERPAVGVPSPTCNGVINESGPCKDEEKKGSKMRAFGETANCNHWSVARDVSTCINPSAAETYVIAANIS